MADDLKKLEERIAALEKMMEPPEDLPIPKKPSKADLEKLQKEITQGDEERMKKELVSPDPPHHPDYEKGPKPTNEKSPDPSKPDEAEEIEERNEHNDSAHKKYDRGVEEETAYTK